MKSALIKNTLFSILLALCCLGCSSNSSKTTQEKATSVSASTQEANSHFYINSATNENLAEIMINKNELIVETPDTDLFGVLKGEKRKYYDRNDEYRYAVKYKNGESFKLRDQQEQLLWKVKLYDDKIKISRTEEMTDAYKINLSGSKIKLKKDDTEIESIRFIPDEQTIRIKDQYAVRNFGNSLATGILLIEGMPAIERYIICAELLLKGY